MLRELFDGPLVRLGLSAAGGLLTYIVWYRLVVGPWCPAMWGGTAPPVIMLFAAAIIWRLIRAWSGPDE